ncbi:MAG TPA: TMEM165/GDT1 family protein [Candidatus Omnitrophota bacterium]|jgi:putative Ca2+/H+ antiporter (TMEM165/GDT1 family)|nr:TMEM165/GDT1 family protein [Candidatus Omnitrophota bacterium]HRY85405.1 TMEM165/GDT1 family protein [Candidatus Omnitrophota bacterium]
MDLKVFLATFSAIFFAELADKTQLVGITMSAKTGKPLSVFLGSVAGYMLVTLISVVLGTLLAKYIKPEFIRYGGATAFVVIGFLMFFNKI